MKNISVKVISACDDNMRFLSNLSFPSIENFCKNKGFKCERFEISNFNRPPAWFKIFKLIEEISNSSIDYFIWMDADSIVHNTNFDLLSLISEEKQFYISKDLNNFNTGVFIVKNSEYVLDFLKMMYSMEQYNHHIWWEQAAFIDLFENNYNNIKNEIKIVDQNILNAYDYRYYGLDESHPGHYNENSFAIHFPSLALQLRFELIKKLIK